jgi:23S rRNA (cytidine1920-2'-O)/16S rRNA (cytidine1409-2'-O)-methyltransferase
MSNKKMRIDKLLVERDFFESREKAKRALMAGNVKIKNEIIDKPGTRVPYDSDIEVTQRMKYVGRGGYKLEKALEYFNINLDDKVCMDIGASTGGFTDCMLQYKARKVYSVDVGYGQLDWSLRSSDKVVVYERTNFRYFKTEEIKEKIDFFTADVSFISLKHIFPNVGKLAEDGSIFLSLIKPQFEAGKDKVEKGGIIRNIDTHYEVLNNVVKYAEENNFYLHGLTFSPIKGAKGNIEYLGKFLRNCKNSSKHIEKLINVTIKTAFSKLND